VAASLAVGAELPLAARLADTAAGIATGKLGTAVIHPADLPGALQARAVLANKAKVVASESTLERIRRWRAKGERIAFTNGCLHLIHPCPTPWSRVPTITWTKWADVVPGYGGRIVLADLLIYRLDTAPWVPSPALHYYYISRRQRMTG
jgi:hypothetical protein